VSDPYTHRDLVGAQYADSSRLKTRKGLYAFRRPPLDIIEFTEALVDWRGHETLVDCGCGTGDYISGFQRSRPGVRSFGIDLSPNMAAETRAATAAHVVVADASALPLPAAFSDVTLAMHMLYHVPDPALAVSELRRVTKRGGVALVGLNSSTSLRELRAIFAEAVASVAGRPVAMPASPDDRLNIENAQPLLERSFESVRRKASWGTLFVTDATAVAAYVDSWTTARSLVAGGDDGTWQRVLDYTAARAGAIIAEQGAFEIAARFGVFVCR
jgi:SAM-dependent methyltransferase